MIVKILKGRSFSGLLDYLFNPQDKSPPGGIEARGSPDNQRISEVPPPPESSSRKTDRAGPSKEMSPEASTENQQRGDRTESGKANHEQRGYLEQHKKNIATNLSQYSAQVTATAGQVKEEFQHQLKILQVFFDETLKISDKNGQMVGRCQEMVATSSAIYNKGSAGVQEVSEKTQAHLKAAAEAHRKEIETQAQHFKMTYKRLSKLIVIGTIVILLCAFVAGTMAGAMWIQMKQHQAEETRR